jgi:chromosome segregation protein
MRIKEIEITGFKTFVDRVKLQFKPGITALVGPNGCGKSNIVDAVRWIIGEQNARNLRGKAMEDLIFNGSDTRKPHGMAEVSLVLTNENGNTLANALNEIMVTRRLFRSGESEYLINKTPCRLKDISELFLDSGVGTKSYSIIEQGKVDHILSLKPYERRTLIEEAAGIAKYRARKKEALSKMESTKNNLLRIRDILFEMQNQLNILERQVKRLKRYQKIKEEVKSIDLLLALHKLQRLRENQTQHEQELTKWKDEQIRLTTQKESGEAFLQESRLSLSESTRLLGELQQSLYQTNNKLQAEQNRIEYNKKEQKNIFDMQNKQTMTLTEIEREFAALKEEIQTKQNEADSIQSEIENFENTLKHNQEILAETKDKLRAVQEAVEKEKAELIQIISTRTELRNAITLNLNLQKELDLRLKKLTGEKDTCQLKIQELENTLISLEKQLQETIVLKEHKQTSIEDLKQKISLLSSELNEKEAMVNELKDKTGTTRSRLISLQDLQKNFEGFDDGVRAIMKRNGGHDAEHNAIIGLFADVIETSPQYETAIEAVLGRKLQSIIVQDQKDCIDAVEYLKLEHGGRASFVPLRLRDDVIIHEAMDGNGGMVLSQVVKKNTEYQQLIDRLLGDVVVADNISQAIEIWNTHSITSTIVTLEGEIIEPPGMITGGSSGALTSGILQRKREIRELSQQLTELESQFRIVNTERQEIAEQINQLSSILEGLTSEKHDVDIKFVQEETNQKKVMEELQQQREKLKVLTGEYDENSASLFYHQRELKQLTIKETFQKAKEDEKQKVLKALQTDEQNLKINIETLEALNTDLKVNLAAANEKRENALNNLNRLLHDQNSAELKMASLQQEIQDFKSRMTTLSQEIKQSEEGSHTLIQANAELKTKIRDEENSRNGFEENVKTGEEALKNFRSRWDEIEPQLQETNLKLSELAIRSDHLREEMVEKYQMDLKQLPQSTIPVIFVEEEFQERLAMLKKRIERIGEVNLAASKECEDLQERYDFLLSQEQDLTQALESLQRVITKINRTTKQKFITTFDEVNKHFQEIFPILFNGGKAYLQLTDEADLLETGIEIFARPPGKKLQNLDLFSGGERALTVVALLFAIFLAKPSPFCLLDEIDAALDDINIERFNKHLQALTVNSQFIIVTHNKQSMQFADTLYGITMEERGVSKILSVELH